MWLVGPVDPDRGVRVLFLYLISRSLQGKHLFGWLNPARA